MPTLDPTDEIHLSQILNHASDVIHAGHVAYERRAFTIQHKLEVTKAYHNMVELLGAFEDKGNPGSLCPELRQAMRYYEILAADLLDGIEKMRLHNSGLHAGEPKKVGVGRYELRRQFISPRSGIPYEKVVVCANPAFGLTQLDAWEDALRQTLERGAAA